MTQATDPDDRNRDIDRQLRSLNRRLERLEETQITNRELNRALVGVYDEIDLVEAKLDDFRGEFETFRSEVNQKLDTILRHLTGINDS